MIADKKDRSGAGHRDGEPAADRRSAARTGGRTGGTGGKRAAERVTAAQAMRYAVEQLQELLGRTPESVSTVKPTDEGWEAAVEVLELERVPSTTSVMASYRVRLDDDGGLVAYERVRRYTRGQIDSRM
ncbi:gas vesicle protein [Streptomyces catenulae]|uniref:Gas vesicle protein n=1 Tax=Streptomyces catenulae TaxID=66875 RepID=A0ABV2YSS4_9ACTN|nr:gas vesicle protein [Streptomyces catenulae]